jgi:hypothetical protein
MKNRMGLPLQHHLRYADEGEDMLNHECITTNPNRSVFQCNGNIPVHLQLKCSKFKVTQSACRVFGFSGSTISSFSKNYRVTKDGVLDRDKSMDKVQKHNTCTNVPSSHLDVVGVLCCYFLYYEHVQNCVCK